jgi:hypothetical protein
MINLETGRCTICDRKAIVTPSGVVCPTPECGGLTCLGAAERRHFINQHPDCGPPKPPKITGKIEREQAQKKAREAEKARVAP